MKLILVSIGRYGPLYSYIPKWVQSAKVLRSYDVIKTCQTWKLQFFAKKWVKIPNLNLNLNIWIWIWISEFQRIFCLYKRKMVISTCSVSFIIIVCRYFSKWRIKMSKTINKRLHLPPNPLTLTAYPTPGKVVPPFFSENDRKGCKRDFLYALGYFL